MFELIRRGSLVLCVVSLAFAVGCREEGKAPSTPSSASSSSNPSDADQANAGGQSDGAANQVFGRPEEGAGNFTDRPNTAPNMSTNASKSNGKSGS